MDFEQLQTPETSFPHSAQTTMIQEAPERTPFKTHIITSHKEKENNHHEEKFDTDTHTSHHNQQKRIRKAPSHEKLKRGKGPSQHPRHDDEEETRNTLSSLP